MQRLDHSSDGLVNDVDLSVSVNGDAFAVWSQRTDEQHPYLVRASRYSESGSSWSDPIVLSASNGYGATNLRVVTDAHGNGIVIWTEHNSSGSMVALNQYYSGSWSGSMQPSPEYGGYVPWVVFDQAGNAFATWVDDVAGESGCVDCLLQGRRLDAQSWTWGEIDTIAATDGYQYWPRVAVDGGGLFSATWLEGTAIHFDRFNTVWSDADQVMLGSTNGYWYPEITAGGSNIFAVWGYGEDIGVYRGTVGQSSVTWNEREVIDTKVDDVEVYFPRIFADSSGDALAVWIRQTPPTYSRRVWSSRFHNGDWSSPEAVSAATGTAGTTPDMAFDSNGDALSVWVQQDEPNSDVVVSRYRAAP